METVQRAVERFYEALNRMFVGEMDLMDDVWSHADDVSYLGPQGDIIIGWEGVRAAFQGAADICLKGEVKPHNIHLLTHGELGFSQNFEVGHNVVNGKKVDVNIRALNLFRKENGVWKMISHQTDTLSFF